MTLKSADLTKSGLFCSVFDQGKGRLVLMATRKVSKEERQLLLEHPELLMFKAGNDKSDFAGGIKMIFIPAAIAVLPPIPLCFTAFAEAHPDLVVILSLLWVIAVICVSVPLIMRYSARRTRKAAGDHNINILRHILPEELVRSVVTIKYIVPQQCEGAYTEDGKECSFGYLGYKNYIPLIPDTKIVIVRDDADFFAFVKRDSATESLYLEN